VTSALNPRLWFKSCNCLSLFRLYFYWQSDEKILPSREIHPDNKNTQSAFFEIQHNSSEQPSSAHTGTPHWRIFKSDLNNYPEKKYFKKNLKEA